MSARDFKVDVEHEGERARDDDLVLRQLGHGDVQGLAGVGLRGVEGDALHGPLGLHSTEHFLRVRREQALGHGHGILWVSKFEISNTYVYPCVMAEGGYDPTETTEKTPLIPGDDDDDDDDTTVWDNLNLDRIPDSDDDTDRTQPFTPGAASTPSGEKIPMATRTRLPKERRPRTAETSFSTGFGGPILTQEQMARAEISSEFPNASLTELNLKYEETKRSGGAIIMIKYHNSDKWYPLYTKSRGDLKKNRQHCASSAGPKSSR